MTQNLNKLLSPQEVSELLGIKENVLACWRCRKTYEIPYIKVGGKVRYKESDVWTWLDTRTKNNGGAND